MFFCKEKFGDYVEATRVARNGKSPALAAAVLRPGGQRRIDVNDLHCSLCHAHDSVLREAARHVGIKVMGRFGVLRRMRGGEGDQQCHCKIHLVPC